jgi:hypothetical protein
MNDISVVYTVDIRNDSNEWRLLARLTDSHTSGKISVQSIY